MNTDKEGSMEKEKIIEKLDSLFKEETWGRIDPKDVGVSKFRILEDLLNSIISEGLVADISAECRSHVSEFPHSITARYLLGMIAYQANSMGDKGYLKNLVELFITNHKWAVVEHISQKILEYGENRFALKSLATSLERLSRQREAIPVWEELLKIDRFDSEVAKKLSFAILEDDPAKSVYYMKLSLEAFIRNGEFDELDGLWGKLAAASWEDFAFFERIERMLLDAKKPDLAVEMFRALLKKYREADHESAILILKKVLEYEPGDLSSRNELLRFYREKYNTHSQLEQFIKISRLDSSKAPVGPAVKAFENYIIFDAGNHVMHRSWGLGTILSMDSETMVVDFPEKKGHQMSMQMALSSLTPVGFDHFYVRQALDPDGLKKLLSENINEFFHMLLSSFGGTLTSGQLKKDLIPAFVAQSSWSKWWAKAKAELRKDPIFGFDEPKAGDLYLREKPVSYCAELVDRFRRGDSFSSRLDTALDFINNIPADEGKADASYLIDFFKESAGLGSKTKLMLSYFALGGLSKFSDAGTIGLDAVRTNVDMFIRESTELPLVSMKISSYDNKKDFVNLIISQREDWKDVVFHILFETPVRIHRYIISSLIRAHAYSVINSFIDRAMAGSRQSPEIILWVSKNIFAGEWDYEWLDYSKPRLVISLFRMINDLKRFETKGSRLKNMVTELLFGGEGRVLDEIVAQSEAPLLGKVYDISRGAGLFEDSQVDRIFAAIKKKYPEFKPAETVKSSEDVDYEEEILVTQSGFDRKTAELGVMFNSEMARLSKDLSAASDGSSDMRENVDYNALMEKQVILKQAITRLDADLKKAKIIDFAQVSVDQVSVGTKVRLSSPTGDRVYTILGPWDADFENGILSYRSPIARALLKKKTGDDVVMHDGTSYKISMIEKGQ
jgi:transcription elongation factor GreA